MTLYALCDWERNGPNDSDWYALIYNDEANAIHETCIGTTRFANALPSLKGYLPLTLSIVERARLLLEAKLFEMLKAGEHRRVFDFDELSLGTRVRLTTKHKNMTRIDSPCVKCNATGKWTNPKNAADKRDCFSCNGRGQIDGGKAKDENGKQAWSHFAEGTEGEVIDTFAFGKFFSNGYKQKNRETLNAAVKMDDGTVFGVPFKKLRLTSEVKDDAALKEIARQRSYEYHFAGAFASWFAWYDHNYAAGIADASRHEPPIVQCPAT